MRYPARFSPSVTGFAQLNVGRSEVYFQTASRRDFNTMPTTRPDAANRSSFI